MAVGPGGRIIVPSPSKGQPSVSLLSSANPGDPMPEGERDDIWLNGIGYTPQTCSGGEAVAVGCTPTVGQTSHARDLGETMPAPVYTNPFMVTAYDECSTLGWEERNYVQRAQNLLATYEAYLVEKEVWSGAGLKAYAATQGISLGDGPDDLPAQYLAQTHTLHGGAALDAGVAYTKPLKGIAAIVEAAADCNGGAPVMFHVAEGFRPILERYYTIKRSGNKLVDSEDNIWVPGAGYPNTGPDGTTPPEGQYWIYATSMMRYWRTDVEVFPGNYREAMVRDNGHNFTNSIRFWAQRYYLVDWDRCCHFAALIDISNIS